MGCIQRLYTDISVQDRKYVSKNKVTGRRRQSRLYIVDIRFNTQEKGLETTCIQKYTLDVYTMSLRADIKLRPKSVAAGPRRAQIHFSFTLNLLICDYIFYYYYLFNSNFKIVS